MADKDSLEEDTMEEKGENIYFLVKILFKDKNPGLVEVKNWFEDCFVPKASKHAESLKLVEFSAPKFLPLSGKTVAKGAEVKIAVKGAKKNFRQVVADLLLNGKKTQPWFKSFTIYILKKENWKKYI